MAILLSILEAIKGFFKSLELFDKWFTTSPSKQSEDAKAELDKEQDRIEHGGKPKW